MKRITSTQAKASLGKYLRTVKDGQRYVITDYGKAIAVLGPLNAFETDNPHIQELIQAGLAQPPLRKLSPKFIKGLGLTATDPEGKLLQFLLDERARNL